MSISTSVALTAILQNVEIDQVETAMRKEMECLVSYSDTEPCIKSFQYLSFITQSIEQANSHHPTIKFTAELSDTDTTFLDTSFYKGERFANESILDIKTHFKPTETFQYTHFSY